jgi:DNA polymerase III sliding clamp (beta) subunit (PCNA family)
MDQNKVFIAKLTNCTVLKKLIETCKDIVSYMTFHINIAGINVITMDSSHVALVSFHLEPLLFEEYSCLGELVVTVPLSDLARTFKFHKDHESVILSIDQMIGGLHVVLFKGKI